VPKRVGGGVCHKWCITECICRWYIDYKYKSTNYKAPHYTVSCSYLICLS